MSATIHIIAATNTCAPVAKTGCAACALKQLCLPVGLDDSQIGLLDKIIGRRRKVARDEPLFRMDEPFRNLYAIRLGHFKTHQLNAQGQEQVTGFQMAGELLGMDAIGAGRHHCGAVALEDSEVCEIPFERLEQLFGEVPRLAQQFHRIMSQEIMREQTVMQLLGRMRAEQRFATFLLNLSLRYAARGYSPARFHLRMSREEIGNYLGLTIESISRLLSKFKAAGLIKIGNRDVEIVDRATMQAMASGVPAQPLAPAQGAQAMPKRAYALA